MMLSMALPDPAPQPTVLPAGTVVLRRGKTSDLIYYVTEGRLALGLLGSGSGLAHQLGWIEGPSWLDPGSAVLGLPSLMDVVADTAVQAHPIAVRDFSAALDALPAPTLTVMKDLARAHRQQAELAASRLGKDAEARCAEWLLGLIKPSQAGGRAEPAVVLSERKRTIAAQLGIAPETFSRVLRQLRERQLISGKGRQLTLLDIKGLRSLAGA